MSRATVVTIGVIIGLLLSMRGGFSDAGRGTPIPSPARSSLLPICQGNDNQNMICTWDRP